MPSKAVCKLQVLPPFSSYLVSHMDHFTGAVEAQLMVAQRKHADNLRDRRDAATHGSHVHPCFVTSESYLLRGKLLKIKLILRGAKRLAKVHHFPGCPITHALNLLPCLLSMSDVPKYSELSVMNMVMGKCMPCDAVGRQRFANS